VLWIGGEYLTTLAAQGVAYFAWVYTAGHHDRTSMEQALRFATEPAIAIFDDVASAYEWLQHCPTLVVEAKTAQ
jgi:hypothetical protein